MELEIIRCIHAYMHWFREEASGRGRHHLPAAPSTRVIDRLCS
jgi:hypothetical protein